MPKILIVGVDEFEFPIEGESGNYGSEVTAWATAVSDALTTVVQPNDITKTEAAILNNQLAPVSVAGFSFDTAEVVSVNSEYIITRTTDVPAVTLVESGFIQGNYNGSSWTIIVESIGDSGVSFDITSGGQITYVSSNLTGSNYSGSILFRAKVFNESI